MRGKVRLFGRAYCHLCEDMAQALRKLGVDFEEIDVDSDPRLDELYGAEVPVLQTEGGDELCRHRLTPEALDRLMKV